MCFAMIIMPMRYVLTLKLTLLISGGFHKITVFEAVCFDPRLASVIIVSIL